MNNTLEILIDILSQSIGIIGTLSGAILGWLLRYLQDNLGKTEISIEYFQDYKDKNDIYGYNLTLFICNHSLTPRYMRDIKIVFYNNKKQIVIESKPKYGQDENTFLSISSKEKVRIINLKYNEPKSIVLCDLMPIVDNNLNLARRIMLIYKNKNGRTKKIKIKDDFLISKVTVYPYGESFPNF